MSRFFTMRRLALAAGTTIGGGMIAERVANDELDTIWPPKRVERKQSEKRKVVLLGTGWAGLSFVRKLDYDVYDLTIVSPRPYFFYTPLLAGAVTGTVQFHNIIEPIRMFCSRTGGSRATYVKASCEQVDLHKKTVKCKVPGGELVLPYDELVVSVGCEPNTFGTPGVTEHGLFLKEIEHGQAVQNRVLSCLESAAAMELAGAPKEDLLKMLHFMVVGGGPTGVELSAELSDFVKNDVTARFPRVAELVQLTLVEAMPRVLSMFDESLSEYAVDHLEKRGVHVLTRTAVKSITSDSATVRNPDGTSTTMGTGMLVWVAGVTARPLTWSIASAIGKESQGDRRGLKVDGHLKVAGIDGVWAIGDCALTGNPPTGQVAAQEGKYLGRLFRDTDLSDPKALESAAPFDYHHLGTLAYIGGAQAIAQISNPLGKGPASDHFFWRSIYQACENDHDHHTINVSGWSAFGFWRSVYFTKLLSGRNRISVAFDWLRTIFNGREVTAASLVDIDFKPAPDSVSKQGMPGGDGVRALARRNTKV